MIAAAATAVAGAIAFTGPSGASVLRGSGPAHVVVPGATDPAWSPDGKRLAVDLRGNIAVAGADGSGLHTITAGPGDLQPAWSPDGRTIVFTRVAPSMDAAALWSVPADGSAAPTPLIRDAGEGGPDRARFLADGSRLLFHRLDGLWSARPDGTGQRHLTLTSSVEVVPSPEGSLYAVGVAGGQAYVMDHAGSTQRRVGGAHTIPLTFSGDDDQLLLARKTDAEVVDPIGIDSRVDVLAEPGLADGSPAWWSPGPAPRAPGPVDGEAPALFLETEHGRLARVRRGAHLRLSITGIDLLAVDRSGIRSLRVTIHERGHRPRSHSLATPDDLRRIIPFIREPFTLRFRAVDVLGHARTTTITAEVHA